MKQIQTLPSGRDFLFLGDQKDYNPKRDCTEKDGA